MTGRLAVVGSVLCALVLLLASGARAQGPPELSASLDVRETYVGRPFSVTLDVSSESGSPEVTDPRLPVPQGVKVLGAPSVSTSTQISITNFHMRRSAGVKVVWQVVASSEGTFAIGPPSVAWSGRRLSASPLTLTVHGAPRGGSPPAPGAIPSPLNPFSLFPPGVFDTPPSLPPADDPEVQMDRPVDPNVFLRAVPSIRSAVVGQQITLSVYLYVRDDLGIPSLSVIESHEPSTADFFRKDMLPPNAPPEPRSVTIAGVPWQVRVVYRSALFALRAGDLAIGEMRQTFVGRSFGGRTGAPRSTKAITIHVAEPPLAGRPPGYSIGDVGSYSLGATVEPRNVEVGSAVAVTATVKGVGNLPATLRIPTQASLEWLDPQVRETVDIDAGKVGGSRTFTYIVRPKSAGTIDFGTLALPYWDPDRRAYEVARAALGNVVVAAGKGVPAAAAPSSSEQDPFRAVAPPRAALGRALPARTAWTDRPAYWALLLGAPFAVLLGSGLARAARASAARWRVRAASPERRIRRELAEAREAQAKGDVQKAAAALDRAVYAAIENATGIRARSLLRDEIPAELQKRGIAPGAAGEIRDVLTTLEEIRFTPGAKDALSDLVERAARVVGDLSKRPGGRRPPSAFAAALLLVLLGARSASAAAPEAVFRDATQELAQGSWAQAIDRFESLADQGFSHPDASYNRGVAYVERIKAGAERPGDLGRAAAAFEETLLLRPGDVDADAARDAVRAEVARRRAQGGGSADVEARPTLDRALVGLAGETMWAVLALAASAVLTIGLLLRALGRTGGSVHLAGAVASPIGAILVVSFGALALGARHLRRTTEDGVIVATEARFSDERGIPIGGLVPEAAKVEISDRRGGLVRVRWGTREGWISAGTVRRLARP